jgi:hypothetical protein
MTIGEKIKQARKHGVYTEYELNNLIPVFLANKEYDKINRDKQNRHIVGTYEFKLADAKSKRLGFAGTAFFDKDFDIFKEIENIRGTGLIDFDCNGQPIEEIVKVQKEIGFGGKHKLIRTNVISIRYSKTESHAFPVDPADYDNVRIRKEKTCIGLTTRHATGVSRTGFYYNIQSFFSKVKKYLKRG